MQGNNFYVRYVCYTSYTPSLYRLLTLLLLPVGLPVLCGGLTFLSGAFFLAPMLCFYLFFDLVADHFVFGGSLTKGALAMELVKSSDRGMDYFRNIIAFDTARRGLVPLFMVFFYRVLTLALSALLGTSFVGEAWGSVEACLYQVMILFAIEGLTLLLARRTALIWVNMLLAYTAIIVMLLLFFAAFMIPPLAAHPPVYLILGLFLALLSGWLLSSQSIQKRKDSYYDETNHS